MLRNITLAPPKDLDHYFTDFDLRKAIRQLKRGKSSKPSGVPNEIWMLFLSHQELRGDLLAFFNLCFARGAIPDQWSYGEVVELYNEKWGVL